MNENDRQKEIFQYIRKVGPQRQKMGAMVAFKRQFESDTIYIGYSKIHPLDEWKGFDRELAMKIAKDRAFGWEIHPCKSHIPFSIENDFAYFIVRAMTYFRTAKIPVWILRYLDFVDSINKIKDQPKREKLELINLKDIDTLNHTIPYDVMYTQ